MNPYAETLRMTPPADNGRHPEHAHLVYAEADPHHGSYIVTSPAVDGDILVSYDDLCAMFGDQHDPDGDTFGYISDEYADHFQPS